MSYVFDYEWLGWIAVETKGEEALAVVGAGVGGDGYEPKGDGGN
ncbi:hypothetical protein [Terricaulis sp.]|nr:hypothetical protein [Terricaulis sp.]MDZ4689836.1 hypothetical protein [Terricaulis sp.]